MIPSRQAATTQILYPPESQAVVFQLVNPDQGLIDGTTPVYAAIVPPCTTANNTSPAVSATCAGLP